MNSMRRKLRSQKGASITFALLLFLVCAIVSGIVIVAATAATGRMDQIAESDRRYYAVTSAAELLKDALDGKTVIVETVETSEFKKDATGDEIAGTRDHYVKKAKMYFESKTTTPVQLDGTTVAGLSVLGDAAYRVANNAFKHMPDVNMEGLTDELVDGVTLAAMPRTLSLAASGTDIADALSVEIYEKAETNGIITFYVRKQDAKDASKAYVLELSFKADVKTNVDEQTRTDAPQITNVGGVPIYTTVATTTRTTETTMRWTLTGIYKGVWP